MFNRISVRSLWPALLIGCAASGQQTRPLHFALAEVARFGGPHRQHVRAGDLGDHPAQVQSADYSLKYATRNLVPLMRRSAAAGDMDGRERPGFFIAVDGRPNLLIGSAPNGTFREISESVPAAVLDGSLAAAFSDYDHSGHQSLFLAGSEGLALYRNNGAHSFSDVTRKAGLQTLPGVLYTSVAIGDLDGDGFPDLLAAAYTDLTHPPEYAVFTFPDDFHGADSRLYRNNRDGTFTDITDSAGLGKNPGRARKAIFADFNNDQRLDILSLRDDKPPVLYLNRGNWKFEDKTWDAGDDLTTHAFFEGAVADFNHDGKSDLALWSTHSFRVLLNQGNGVFERLDSTPLPDPMTSLFGFRGAIADLDGNGFDDVLTVDRSGKWHFFTNVEGHFREVPPPALGESPLDSVIPARCSPQSALYLVTIRQDARVTLWKRREAPGRPPQ
jgi:hypothetical protein